MNKVKSLTKLLLLLVFVAIIAGCGSSQKYDSNSKAISQICVTNTSNEQLTQAAETVLGKMEFSIAKSGSQRGFILTKPLAAAKFFEFWRKDNIGRANKALANLHSIRRIVQIDTIKQGQQLCINCNVELQRLSLPEQQLTGSRLPRFQTELSGQQQTKNAVWLKLERDKILETEILKRIERKLTTN